MRNVLDCSLILFCNTCTKLLRQENEDDDEGAVSAKDTGVMMGLLEAIIILWEGSGKIFKVTIYFLMQCLNSYKYDFHP